MLDALPLENIASFGPDIDGLIAFIWWIVAGWLIVAEAALVYALIFFRKKDGVRASWLPGRSTVKRHIKGTTSAPHLGTTYESFS